MEEGGGKGLGLRLLIRDSEAQLIRRGHVGTVTRGHGEIQRDRDTGRGWFR